MLQGVCIGFFVPFLPWFFFRAQMFSRTMSIAIVLGAFINVVNTERTHHSAFRSTDVTSHRLRCLACSEFSAERSLKDNDWIDKKTRKLCRRGVVVARITTTVPFCIGPVS